MIWGGVPKISVCPLSPPPSFLSENILAWVLQHVLAYASIDLNQPIIIQFWRCQVLVRRLLMVAVFALVLTLLAGVVSAHHAVAGYDKTKTLTLKGVVTQWRWRNPHIFLMWNVTDEKGTAVEWTGEMASPMTMTALGLSRQTFKAGDEVTAEVMPASNGTPHSIIRKVMVNGKVVVDQNPLVGTDPNLR